MEHRDDLLKNDEYPFLSQHSEEEGKSKRGTSVKVSILLAIVTIIEVMLGIFIKQDAALWTAVKWIFIVLTLLKAGYILMSFMHLGHEQKNLQRILLYPYCILIAYLLIILLKEASSHLGLV